MTKVTLIKNALIINEGKQWHSDLLLKNGIIEKVAPNINYEGQHDSIDATDLWLIPGVIDDQVHFREPGLTHKASIYTEARAAIAGGVTSFMEMPNTNPPATTQERLEEKYTIAANYSLANYSFFMGVANNNVEEVLKTNAKKKDVCGIKIFMGSSTGDMLVDNYVTLNTVFRETELLIATHCENEQIISANKEKYQHADNVSFHPLIRNEEACFASSFSAVQLAKQNNTRLHILHITTAKELQLFSNMLPLKDKQITNEVCVHHLHFTANDYEQYGNLIQCNPAIKASNNRDALWEALLDDRLDIIATDHAPHTWEEKQLPYGQAPSGLPLVQHSLPLLLSYVQQGKISIEKLVEKMCHAPAVCFELNNRGYIREGYAADLVLINPKLAYQVNKNNIYYKCAWSPLEGMMLPMQVITTFVNGHKAYDKGVFDESVKGQRLQFR